VDGEHVVDVIAAVVVVVVDVGVERGSGGTGIRMWLSAKLGQG